MNRRKIIYALGSGALAPLASLAPRASFAQQKIYRLAILHLTNAESARTREDALWLGLKELGYTEGVNLAIDRRYADGQASRLPGLAAELVMSRPDVICAPTTPAAHAVKEAANAAGSQVPIVITLASDPVGSGFAVSLARPGGNITGTTNMQTDIDAKRVQMLKEMIPTLKRVGVVQAGDKLAQIQLAAAQGAGRVLGIEIVAIVAQQPDDYRREFATAKSRGIGAFMMFANSQNQQNEKLTIDLAAQYRVPVIYPDTGRPERGGLISYGTDSAKLYKRAAFYIDKLFKGAKAGELPIEQPTLFVLAVNMKTAKALGIKVPQTILIQATKVIE